MQDDQRLVVVTEVGDHELDDRPRCESDDALGDRLDGRDPQMGEAVQQLGDREPGGRGDDSGDRPAPVLTGQPHASILPHRRRQPKRVEPRGAQPSHFRQNSAPRLR